MSRRRLTWLALAIVAATALTAEAQSAESSREQLNEWQWYLQFPLPGHGKDKYYDLLVPPAIMGHSRSGADEASRGDFKGARIAPEVRLRSQALFGDANLNDLRLIDAKGREVPYALRVRVPVNAQEPLRASQFSPQVDEQHRATVSLDLGVNARHNTIEVLTSGTNFRRRLKVEGSDDNQSWAGILDTPDLLSFQIGSNKLINNRFDYPESRQRYLRVTVFPDPSIKDDKPRLEDVKVFQTVVVPGLDVTGTAHVGKREPFRAVGDPGSAWLIDFQDLAVPCNRLRVEAEDNEFVRPYRLEMSVGDGNYEFLKNGEWRREARGARKPLEINLEREVQAKRLRLVVTDYRNPPLTVTSVEYSAPARQLIFPATAPDGKPWESPLRLYVGKPHAAVPRYDFADGLPAVLPEKPARIDVANLSIQENPEYHAPPLPWSERYPWVVYLVLTAASLVLLLLMVQLARQALARTEKASAGATT